jgi:hypothetical protein
LLADDMALLKLAGDAVSVIATEQVHYLLPQSYRLLGVRPPSRRRGAKVVLPAARGKRKSYPLGLVAVLRSDGRRREPAIRTLTGAEAAQAIFSSIVRFDVHGSRRAELDRVLTVYRSCPFVEIVRPSRPARVSLVGRLVLSALEGKIGNG